MIKVILRLDCGPGMDSADAYIVSEKDWAEYNSGTGGLSDICWEYAVEHASSYGIYPTSDMPEEDYDEDMDSTEYSDDINGWLEFYDPVEHDGLKVGGGDWKWNKVL